MYKTAQKTGLKEPLLSTPFLYHKSSLLRLPCFICVSPKRRLLYF